MGARTFFMSESELVRQLEETLEKGFDESFASFCAREFASHDYPAENLAPARMHAHYLRLAMDALSHSESREDFFQESEGNGEVKRLFRRIAKESYQEALQSDSPFCELFVENWCRTWSSDRDK